MYIWSRQRLSTETVSPTLESNDFRVTQVATAKSLGVTIDDNLDWGSYIEKIIIKVSSGIKQVRHLVPQATLQLIYQVLIQLTSLQWLLNTSLLKLWDNLKEQTSKTRK